MIDCITHHVCQEIQGVDVDGVDEEVDGEVPPQGGEAAPAWRPLVERAAAQGGAAALGGSGPLALLLPW